MAQEGYPADPAPPPYTSPCTPPDSESFSSATHCKWRNSIVCPKCGQLHERNGPHLYDYHQAVDEDLMCHICLQPLVHPIDTKCGHTYCSRCLKNYLRLQKQCPLDRQSLTVSECQQSSVLVRRDKARQRAYWEQKRASNREARINANPLIIAEKCQSITSVISTTEANTLESSASKPQTNSETSADCDAHEESIQATAVLERDDESTFDAEEYVNICAHCLKESSVELQKCSKCKSFRYCSKECQIFDWPRHKSVCKLLQAELCAYK